MKYFLYVLFLLLGSLNTAFGQVRLPKLISNGMVLQRNAEIKVWGWASEKEPISLIFKGEEYKTRADEDGNWSLQLSDLKAGGPYSMEIKASNEIKLENIFVGDVWIASGQSNMELPMSRVEPLYSEEIATAKNEAIRYFQVPKTFDFSKEHKDLQGGEWKPVSPETIGNFSAAAYFFAKDLNKRYNVPIGVVESALGGSPVEAWISGEALKKFPEHYQEAQRFKDTSLIAEIRREDQLRSDTWYGELHKKDLGVKQNWSSPNFDDSSWQEFSIPGYWSDTELGPKNGVVWFRKTVDIPEDWAGKPVKLLLGRIVDADSVFINGTFVGNTTYLYPPRRYTVPAGVLKPGENIIVVKVINSSGRGGFVPDKKYELTYNGANIDLKGDWKYSLGGEMPALPGQTFIRWKPMGLYNAMIHPLTNYTIKGVIWYQGESNADNWEEYHELFATLIKDWRKEWDQGKFPFLFVQLANFMETKDQPEDSEWARLREAQTETLSLSNTGMAVAIDIGEWNDIHPLNKKTVGNRLAQAAKKVAYNEDIVPAGPLYESHKIKGDSIIVSFKNVGEGLEVKGDQNLKHWAIAGEDKRFVWAKAKIQGEKVIVYSPEIKDPVAVRYAWADNPESANLYNKENLPASPFRTDDWE